ncbi:MAG TPA: GntR family transcriptional regulator [Pseudonocardia sp.]|uniref:GntR family transcriptional regulator n=1 Tax=Pseudonocardia sp. TaxID=60912 RepID=UPI002D1B69CD|nr:GntR family transcriptional regulator [Pseudonocardia sp.]HTF49597.1 GntR family transcriptional regulator [Pseudonocardia sp.]
MATGGERALVGPATRQILTDSVYDAVKALIMDDVVRPGAKLNMDALARDLAVSQTPIREALARLESERLVVKEPLRGYTSAPLLSAAAFEELYEFRLHLEPWAAGRAAERTGPAGRAALAAELATCNVEPPAGAGYADYKAFASHDARFHDLVMGLAGNETARAALADTHCHLHIFRLFYSSRTGATVHTEHADVVAAIGAADPPAAAAAMRAHLKAARDRLRPYVR